MTASRGAFSIKFAAGMVSIREGLEIEIHPRGVPESKMSSSFYVTKNFLHSFIMRDFRGGLKPSTESSSKGDVGSASSEIEKGSNESTIGSLIEGFARGVCEWFVGGAHGKF